MAEQPVAPAPVGAAFAELPLGELTSFLQRLGWQLVTQTLGGRTPQLLAAVLGVQGGLAALDRWSAARVLRRAHAPRRARRQRARRRTPTGLDRAVSNLVTGRSALQAWPGLLSERIRLSMKGPVGGEVPPALILLAGRLAWGSPLFQEAFARWTRRELRSKIIFPPGQVWTPKLSPETVWALIALRRLEWRRFFFAGLGPWFRPAFWRRARAVRNSLRSLQETGRQAALGGEWAGFWDQWLLAKALAAGPGGSPARELGMLPFVVQARQAGLVPGEADSAVGWLGEGPAEPEQPSRQFAKPTWRREVPDFLQDHFFPPREAGGEATAG